MRSYNEGVKQEISDAGSGLQITASHLVSLKLYQVDIWAEFGAIVQPCFALAEHASDWPTRGHSKDSFSTPDTVAERELQKNSIFFACLVCSG